MFRFPAEIGRSFQIHRIRNVLGRKVVLNRAAIPEYFDNEDFARVEILVIQVVKERISVMFPAIEL